MDAWYRDLRPLDGVVSIEPSRFEDSPLPPSGKGGLKKGREDSRDGEKEISGEGGSEIRR